MDKHGQNIGDPSPLGESGPTKTALMVIFSFRGSCVIIIDCLWLLLRCFSFKFTYHFSVFIVAFW